jgi:hypothetical protein
MNTYRYARVVRLEIFMAVAVKITVFWDVTPCSFEDMLKIIVKIKEFRNRPGVAQRVPGGLGSQIS